MFLNANLGNGAFWITYLCLCVLVHISVNNPKHPSTNMSRRRLTPSGFAISLHGSVRFAPSIGRGSTGVPCRGAVQDPWQRRRGCCRRHPTTMATPVADRAQRQRFLNNNLQSLLIVALESLKVSPFGPCTTLVYHYKLTH